MIASAPGKLVLSGAYVVLDGAPAIVAAVDRYAVADTLRHPSFVSDELREAFGSAPCPFVDSSSMRLRGRKLGIGSSAAVVVASLAADHLDRLAAGAPAEPGTGELGPRAIAPDALAGLVTRAFEAHQRAQGGGSGVDVVASVFGGVVLCHARPGGPPEHRSVLRPRGLVLEAWLCPESAVTAKLLGPVRAFRKADPEGYEAATEGARHGAALSAEGFLGGRSANVIEGARRHLASLVALDEALNAPIVPAYLRPLGALAALESAAFVPSGAGGGDVAVFYSNRPSSPRFRRETRAAGLRLLTLKFGAPGVHPGYPLSGRPRGI